MAEEFEEMRFYVSQVTIFSDLNIHKKNFKLDSNEKSIKFLLDFKGNIPKKYLKDGLFASE